MTVLAHLHERHLPDVVAGPGGDNYAIPPYDTDAYLVEAELVLDWYAPHVAKAALPASARALFLSVYGKLVREILSGPKTWCTSPGSTTGATRGSTRCPAA